MKKRTVLTTILAIVCCISCMFFAACKQKITVSFETAGDPIAAVQVVKGETYTLPNPAEREGYEFQGWYLTADFSGEAVTVVKSDKDIAVYAKWEQVAIVKLDAAGGTLSETTIKSSVGKKVADLLKDYVPVKTGAQFYAWYNGSRIVNEDTVLPAGGLELTAKYKYKYSVVVMIESAEATGESKNYVKDDVRSYEGYELDGKTISAPKLSGLKLVGGESGTVKENEANEFVFKYDRENVSIVFNSNYPDSKKDEVETRKVLFGTTISNSGSNFECDGYLFVGWSEERNGDADYPVYLKDIYNVSGERPEDGKIVADNNKVLYAVWAKGYTNMFVGSDDVSDLVFVVDEPGAKGTVKVAYLYRGAKYFKGNYSSSSKNFEFRPEGQANAIIGRIVNSSNYVYRSDAEADTTDYYEYYLEEGSLSLSAKMNRNSIMRFDRYNGVEYIEKADDKDENPKTSKGTYVVGETAYEVTFDEGARAGETVYFVRGVINGNNLFQIRDEEQYGKTFNACYVSKNKLVIAPKSSGYYIELDGYGGGVLYAGTQSQQIYCFFDENGNLDVFVGGSRSGKLAIVEQNGAKGYISYSSSLAHTFENGTRKLTLDGAYKATYYDGKTNHEGAYTQHVSSSLGGTVVEFYDADETAYYFLVKSVADSNGSYSYVFEEVASNYSEMSYVRGTSMVSGRLIVVNGETMIVYGVNKNRQYVELARGTYSEENGEKIFTVTSALTADQIAEKEVQPVEVEESDKFFFEYCTDFTNIRKIVFETNRVSSNGSAVDVAYWTVVERKDESVDLNEATEYTDVKGGSAKLYVFGNRETVDTETGKTELALGVFATYIDEDGNSFSGLFMQSTNFRYLAVSVTNNGTTSTRYIAFDVDTEAKTFLVYDYLPVTAYAVAKSGNLTAGEYLTLDGKGGAKHVTVKTNADGEEEIIVEGTIALTGEKVSGVSVYEFVANDGSERFETIIFSAGNYNAFAKKSNDFIGDYKLTVDGTVQTLTLDGYVLAKLSTEDQTSGNMYYFTTEVENQIMLVFSTNSGNYTYYIDLDQTNRTYTVRGSVYGSYLMIKNQSATGMWFELDGYGTVADYAAGVKHAVIKDYKKDDKGNFLRDDKNNYIEYTVSDEATYKFDTENDKTYVYIKYPLKNNDGSIRDWVEYKGILTVVTSGSNNYAAFVEVATEVEETYVNNEDWSMLVLTSYGVARKIDGRTGTMVSGSYVLIADGLLYFRTDSESGIFRFDTQTREITALEYRNQGYYTEDLYSFYFSKDGYADYAKGDEKIRYYYTVKTEDGVDAQGNKVTKEKVTLYYQDWYNDEHNEYGFVVKDFGYHDNTEKEWEGDLFYGTDGAEVSFARNAANADKYAISSGGKKYLFGAMTFTPNGSDEFSVNATVELLLENGEPYTDEKGNAQKLTGYVKREVLEKQVADGDETKTEKYFHSYLQFATNDGGNFMFDVDLSFIGKEGSTYTVNSEEWVMSGSSYRYNEGMMSIYLNYFQTGKIDSKQLATIQSYDYGTLTFKRIYDENGDEAVGERKIIAEFTDSTSHPLNDEDGSYLKFRDQLSSKPTTKGEGENKKNVTVIEAKGFEILNGAFRFIVTDKANKQFMVSVKYQSSQYFSSYGFYFDAISAYSEFSKEVDGKTYNVAVERIVWTENENSRTPGRIYWVSIAEDGKDPVTVTYAANGYADDGLVDYDSRWILSRTIEEVEVEQTTGSGDDKKTEIKKVNRYTSSKLFKVKFSASGIGVNTAYDALESFSVEELNVVYDNERGTSFFEYTVDAQGKVNLVTYSVYQAMYGSYATLFAKTSNHVVEGGREYIEATFFGAEGTYYAEITKNADGAITAMKLLTEKPTTSEETEQAA